MELINEKTKNEFELQKVPYPKPSYNIIKNKL